MKNVYLFIAALALAVSSLTHISAQTKDVLWSRTGTYYGLAEAQYSPDGNRIAVATGTQGPYICYLKLIDAKTGEPIASYSSSPVSSICFCPDGKLLLTCENTNSCGVEIGSLNLRNAGTGRPVRDITQSAAIRSAGFSHDGGTIVAVWGGDATNGYVESIAIYNTASASLVKKLPMPFPAGSHTKSIAFSPDGASLLLLVNDGQKDALVLLGTDGTVLRTILPGAAVATAMFSADGASITASINGQLRQWDATTGDLLHSATAATGTVPFRMSADGSLLVTGGQYYPVQLFDAHTLAPIRTLAGNGIPLGISPDNATVCLGDNGLKVIAANQENALPSQLTAHGAEVYRIQFSPDGKTFVSGENTALIIWNTATGKPLHRLTVPANVNDDIGTVCYSPDGRYVVAGSAGWGVANPTFQIKVWNASTGSFVRSFQTAGDATRATSVAFTPDGRLVAGDANNHISIWNPETGELLTTIQGDYKGVAALACSPDGRFIASSDLNVSLSDPNAGRYVWDVTLWDASTGNFVRNVQNPTNGASISLAFSSDSRTLAGGGQDGTVRIWDVTTGGLTRLIQVQPGTTTNISSLGFTPDGRFVLATAEMNMASLWDVSTGTKVATIAGNGQYLMCASMSPDGRLVASGTNEGDVVVQAVTGTSGVAGSSAIDAADLTSAPNPFSQQTTIRFALKHRAHVSVKMFDPIGRELKTLADGEFQSGNHQTVFTADPGSACGAYLCRLQIGDDVRYLPVIYQR